MADHDGMMILEHDDDSDSDSLYPDGQKDVIDLISSSSSDEDIGAEEAKGDVIVWNAIKEHCPQLLASSPEKSPQQQHNQRKNARQTERKPASEATYQDFDDGSDSDNNSDVDAESDLQSLEFFRNHCWACHVWIHHPGFVETGNQDEICCNALHLHPIWNIPVCVICAETIEAVERKHRPGRTHNQTPMKATSDDRREEKSTACIACGKFHEYEEEYVRCGVCPRAVCPNCFEQANHSISGGDKKNSSSSQKLRMKRPRGEMCLCCSCLNEDSDANSKNNSYINSKHESDSDIQSHYIPPFLQKLRRLTRKLFSSAKSSNGGSKSKQSIEDVLDELLSLETEKRRCELQLDDPQDLLQEIREELWEDHCGGTEDENEEDEILEIRVQQQYEDEHEELIRDQTRLLDRISILGDRLKSEYGIEIAAALRYIEANSTSAGEDEHEGNETDREEIEPAWKTAADNELSKREKEERSNKRKEEKRLAQKRGDDPKYRLEITEDAEDLGSSDDFQSVDDDNSEPDAYDNGWRSAPSKARKVEIETARKAEDIRRVEEGKSELIIRNKTNDMEEFNEWDAGLKSSAMVVKKKDKKRKRLPTKTILLPTERDLSVGMINSPSGEYQTRDRERMGDGNSIHDRKEQNSPMNSMSADTNINIMIPKSKRTQPSSFVLSKNPFICIHGEFDKHLKEHQKEGIKFMYKNSFADLGGDEGANIGGCILAHSMGLGKSLSCVSLLYAVMDSSLADSETFRGKIHKGLLVVPVNTISNWENEFDKWTKGIKMKKLPIFNVSSADKHARRRMVENWSDCGGILLTSVNLFRNMAMRDDVGKLLSATDVIVLDESHTMLKNKESIAYKAFMKIKTPRRICLTGTPFQNNLLEYYRMVQFVRPNLLGDSEKKFQREFMDPIQSSMGSDAPEDEKILADDCLTTFVNSLEPYIHRRDASLLRKDLPSLQQVCLHVPPTKMQRALYRAFRQHQEVTNEKNFLKQYASLRTVHNHPGTLLFRNEKSKAETPKVSISESKKGHEEALKMPIIKTEPTVLPEAYSRVGQEPPDADAIIEISSSDEEEDDKDESYETNGKWWTKVEKKYGTEHMKRIESGNKCVVLLHLLTHAAKLGEKTIVFSQSLKTLDFLSEVVASEDWQNLCPSLKESFPGRSMGGWMQGKDFLRIDGGTSGIERGELLKDFSDDKSLKLFLISSVAGGIGINLVSASRVVLFDSHFNPTIDLQAIYRCYRYGQNRNVFAYRFLTQGSMEEKVYSRAMNKTDLSNRVIDGKKLHRCFEKDEISSLSKVDDWVECVKCRNWRMFPPDHTEDVGNLPSNWHCGLMNKYDKRMKLACSFEEKDSVWYHHHFKKPNEMISAVASSRAIATEGISKLSTVENEALVERDEVLKNLLTIESRSDNSALIVSKHYFHDTFLTDIDPTNL